MSRTRGCSTPSFSITADPSSNLKIIKKISRLFTTSQRNDVATATSVHPSPLNAHRLCLRLRCYAPSHNSVLWLFPNAHRLCRKPLCSARCNLHQSINVPWLFPWSCAMCDYLVFDW
ncbi:glycine cleavage system transcriptional repressor [Sesbania bispinosa]|nr:glycine cleavage system transcriptional repressor [Sesbania bispinosa]